MRPNSSFTLRRPHSLVAVGDVHLDGDRTAPHLPDLLRRLFRVDHLVLFITWRIGPYCLAVSALVIDAFQQDVGDHHIRPRLGQGQRVGPAPARAKRP